MGTRPSGAVVGDLISERRGGAAPSDSTTAGFPKLLGDGPNLRLSLENQARKKQRLPHGAMALAAPLFFRY